MERSGCAICQDQLKEAETLPCLHTFCKQCLLSLAKGVPSPSCPLCRLPFEMGRGATLPQTASPSLPSSPPHSFEDSSPPLFSLPPPSPSILDPNHVICEICDESAAAEAETFCEHCEQFFCPSCQRSHQRAKGTRGHAFITLEAFFERGWKRERRDPCHLHPHLFVDSFCVDCQIPICPSCGITLHSRHGFSSLEEICSSYKKDIQKSYELMKAKKEEADTSIRALGRILETLAENSTLSIEKIGASIQTLQRELFLAEARLIGGVLELKAVKEKHLKLQKEEHEFSLRQIVANLELIENLLQRGTGRQIAQHRRLIEERAENLRAERFDAYPLEDGRIGFEENEALAQVREEMKLIGEILDFQAVAGTSLLVKGGMREREPVGAWLTFWIQGRDQAGREGASGPFKIEIKGPAFLKVSVVETTKGNYQATLHATHPGCYELSVLLRGDHLPLSPFPLEIYQAVPSVLPDYGEMNQPLFVIGSQGGGLGQFNYPRSVATNSRGEIVVADWENHRIQIFHREGRFLFSFGSKGSEPGRLNNPDGLAVDQRDNRFIVADSSNHRIQVFDERGNLVRTFGSCGSREGQLSSPRGVFADPQGRIFVADYGNHRIQAFDEDGRFLFAFGREGHREGELKGPWGIAATSAGNLLISENANHRLSLFDPRGTFLGIFSSSTSNPCQLAVDSRDYVIVRDYAGRCVHVLDERGEWVRAVGGGSVAGPLGVCLACDGRLIISDAGAHKIFVF